MELDFAVTINVFTMLPLAVSIYISNINLNLAIAINIFPMLTAWSE